MKSTFYKDSIFQTFNKDGKPLCRYLKGCIPFDDIEYMYRAGYKFELDGKSITKKQILALKEKKDD